MEFIKVDEQVSLSRVIHGFWRLKDWDMSQSALLRFTEEIIDLGISSFDHADIYGNYEVEALHGAALAMNPSLRKKIQLISKCGIMLKTDKNPLRKVKFYEYSASHIISSVENSLKNLRTDYLDVLLLHRPSPFFDAAEVADAFRTLENQGKVLAFGVSNFNPVQYELLDFFLEKKLVTNQIEISAAHLEHFENNNIDFLQTKGVYPMCWSPLGGGGIMSPTDDHSVHLLKEIEAVGSELNESNIDKILYAWLFAHPSKMMVIAGSGKIHRLKKAVDALQIKMSTEQWFRIYIAAQGKDLP